MSSRFKLHVSVKTLLLTILFSFFLLGYTNQPVNADNSESSMPQPTLISSEKGHGVYAYGGEVQNKEVVAAYFDRMVQTIAGVNPNLPAVGGSIRAVTGTCPCYLSASKSTAYYGSSVKSQFGSNLTTNALDTYLSVSSGSSNTYWYGSSPQVNSTTVRIQDTWRFSFVAGGSVSASGGGISVGGNTASWSGETSNSWYMNHYFSGISGSGLLLQFTETSTGDHYFATTHTWVSATSTKSLWW